MKTSDKIIYIVGTISATIGGLMVVAGVAFLLMNRIDVARANHEERESARIEELKDVSEQVVTVEEESDDYTIQDVSIHPAGHGTILYYKDIEEIEVEAFLISPEAEVEFENTAYHSLSENEELLDEMEAAIVEKFKEEKRAIHFMPGDMNDDRTEGFVSWVSHERESGELAFTVDENGNAILDEAAWEELPKMDEHTTDDFEAVIEKMSHIYRFNPEYSE